MKIYLVAPALGDTVDGERGACGDVNDGGDPGGSSSSAPVRRGSEYAELSRLVRAAGLLNRRAGYYAVRIGLTVALFALGWTVFAWLGPSWWQLAVAAFLAVVFVQLGFLGHDAGHRQVFRSGRRNDLLGLLCANLLIGLSYSWWIDKHNRHHANPNHVDRDPDISAGGVVFTKAQARGAAQPPRALDRAAPGRPVLPDAAARRRCSARRQRQGVARTIPQAAPGASRRCCSARTSSATSPRCCSCCPLRRRWRSSRSTRACSASTWAARSRPTTRACRILGPGDQLDFLRRQVLTSRNIRGGRWVDLAMGGLNYQIEHHLFPSMPSPSLAGAQPLVRDFCLQHDLPYQESTLSGSFILVLRYLHDVGMAAEPPGPPNGLSKSSAISSDPDQR